MWRRRLLRVSCAEPTRRLFAAALLLASAAVVGAGAFGLRAAEAAGTHGHMHHRMSVADDLQSVTRQIMCQCGCNLTVSACEGTMVCEISAQMKREALELLEEGNSVDAVLASFTSDYGEQVLGAPTKKGFNLTAWILPFAALGVGAAVVAAALLRWRRRPVSAPAVLPAPDPALLARVEEEVIREP